ncbi:MAG: hypothetical protein GYA20_04160 [Chloroflexi bacterium]|nr:hypothetical protein [Chloroflexota bacterium]
MDIVNFTDKKRLIVLLPESLAGSTDLAHQINWMASLQPFNVLYLPMVEEDSNPLVVSRRMTTMVAATIGEPMHVSSRAIARKGWLDSLREIYQPGDLLVCMAEQSVKTGFMHAVSMQDYLQDVLQIPCRTVNGYYHPEHDRIRQWLLTAVFWLVALAILIVFSLLEINIDQSLHGSMRIVVLILAVSLELGLLMLWTRIPKF